ncbi:hypothetical protein [Bdellovibrio svalbardensis]|uniref:Uncharacterized protein n=1 Tax=Bdellovibrio svalbardensis TaxID=2972972 RepID=A0ABT6DL66_9BACT|nr:hypothetical protein [Bdellovibrio svalbardensis]MDG0815868.1 hypothetical protein [Bdellovibrio svalbardensis]
MIRVFLVFLILALSCVGHARERQNYYDGNAQWKEFQQFVAEQRAEDEKLGLSYMISGAVATIGGVYGYYAAEEVFSRSMFAITSTVGLAAIGLGASYYWTGNEYDSLYYALEGSGLSLSERNKVLQRYLEKEKIERENRKWIRVATHAVIAAVNFYSASRETNDDAKTVFVFLGGVNALMAVTYSF